MSGAASPGSPSCRRGDRTPRSVAGKASGSPSAAHRDHLGGPRPDAGQGEQLRSGPVPVAPGVEDDVAAGQRADRARSAMRCRDFGNARCRGSMSASSLDGGKDVGQAAVGVGDRLAVGRDEPSRRGCAPPSSTPADPGRRGPRVRASSTVRGMRCPGALATSAPRSASALSASTTASGSASRSSSRRQRAIAADRSRKSSSTSRTARDRVRRQADDARCPCGSRSVRR